jgi:ACS family glucarate transporter-like MFS transporter
VVVWWSAFTALTGAVTGLRSLLVVRFLFGTGEAGAYPNTARVLSRWFPASERGRVTGLMLTSAQLGGAGVPALTVALIWLAGWRLAFAAFGLVGFVWAVREMGESWKIVEKRVENKYLHTLGQK